MRDLWHFLLWHIMKCNNNIFCCCCGAEKCGTPGHNSLYGLCSGGADPFAGVYCNSVEGTTLGVLITDRYDVGGVPMKAGYGCVKNTDCDKYGPGYFCDYFAPGAASKPPPQCVRPAAPACFPLVRVEELNKVANWPTGKFWPF